MNLLVLIAGIIFTAFLLAKIITSFVNAFKD